MQVQGSGGLDLPLSCLALSVQPAPQPYFLAGTQDGDLVFCEPSTSKPEVGHPPPPTLPPGTPLKNKASRHMHFSTAAPQELNGVFRRPLSF
jgi:hypothetical protein